MLRPPGTDPAALYDYDRQVLPTGPLRSVAGGRKLSQAGPVEVLYFDYVFVSDAYRLQNYGSEAAVLADTIAELAFANQIYLIGNRFSPQIQFRIKAQVVLATQPYQFDPSNVPSGEVRRLAPLSPLRPG